MDPIHCTTCILDHWINRKWTNKNCYRINEIFFCIINLKIIEYVGPGFFKIKSWHRTWCNKWWITYKLSSIFIHSPPVVVQIELVLWVVYPTVAAMSITAVMNVQQLLSFFQIEDHSLCPSISFTDVVKYISYNS